MDATPALKRRKLNQAVNKPFRSPLKTPRDQTKNAATAPQAAETPVKTNTDQQKKNATSIRAAHSSFRATPLRQRLNANTATESAPLDAATEQEIQNLLKENRALESSLIKTRQDIDALNQAIRLASSDKDAELDALTIKWRSAARQAAEEVFATAKDKINRQGGVGAWREQQRERAARSQWTEPVPEYDEEEVYDDDGEVIDVIKHERVPRYEDEWEYDAEMREEQKQEQGRADDVSALPHVPCFADLNRRSRWT